MIGVFKKTSEKFRRPCVSDLLLIEAWDFRWRFRRSLTWDGDMKAQHMRMKNSNDDVALTDGQGYFCRGGPFQNHLKYAVHVKDKVRSGSCNLVL